MIPARSRDGSVKLQSRQMPGRVGLDPGMQPGRQRLDHLGQQRQLNAGGDVIHAGFVDVEVLREQLLQLPILVAADSERRPIGEQSQETVFRALPLCRL